MKFCIYWSLVPFFLIVSFVTFSMQESLIENNLDILSARANLELGYLHYKGLTGIKDFQKARFYFEKAAIQDHDQIAKGLASLELAKIYYFAHGVKAGNAEEMSAFLEQACVIAKKNEKLREIITVSRILKWPEEFVVRPFDDLGLNPLLTAAWNGQSHVVDILLEKGADANLCNRKGETALHFAAQKGYTEVANTLFEYGAQLDSRDSVDEGSLPLECALRNNHEEMVRLLIGRGASPLQTNIMGICFLDRVASHRNEEYLKQVFQLCLSAEQPKTPQRTLLHWASERGKKDLVEFALEYFPQDCTDGYGRTPLHYAVRNRYKASVAFLLARGSDVNRADNSGCTALHFASFCAQELVELLLDNGAQLTATDHNGRTALSYAAEKGNVEAASLLLKRGADADSKNNLCETLLQASGTSKDPRVVRLLLDHGASINIVDNSKRTLLHKASIRGRNAIVELLLARGVDPNAKDSNGNTPLHDALRKGYPKVVKLLLEGGASVAGDGFFGRSYLEAAIAKKSKKSLNLLIQYGLNVRFLYDDGKTLLHAENDKDIAAILIENGLDLNIADKQGYTALDYAIKRGDKEYVELLLAHKADLTRENGSGVPPFIWAILCGQKEIVDMFLKRGADPTQTDITGMTPLHRACICGSYEIVKLLIAAGAQVNVCVATGSTPLHAACANGNIQTVQFLLSMGALVNVMDNEGRTPLYEAAAYGHDKLVRLLVVSFNADLNASSKEGFTPYHVAKLNNHEKVIAALFRCESDLHTLLVQSFLQFGIRVKRLSALLMAPYAEFVELIKKGVIIDNAERKDMPVDKMHKRLVAQFLACQGIADKYDLKWTELHCACILGDFARACEILDQSPVTTDCKDSLGRTALHYACQGGFIRIVKLLELKGADPLAVDNDGLTPLARAEINNFPKISDYFREAALRKGLYDEQSYLDGKLLCDVAHGMASTQLVEKGANVNARTSNGSTVLMLAASRGLAEFCRYLKEKGAEVHAVDDYGSTALMHAVAETHCFAKKDNHEVCQFLLSCGIEINCANGLGKSALMLAAAAGNLPMIIWLLENKADIRAIDKKGNSALLYALKEQAAYNNDFDAVCETLIAAGSECNQADEGGKTALHYAVQLQKCTIVQSLLDNGAKNYAKDNEEVSALMVAVRTSNLELCRLLVEACAPINLQAKDGSSALSLAVTYAGDSPIDASVSKIVLLLLGKGASVGGIHGCEMLNMAASHGNRKICKLLLKVGVNPLLSGNKEFNALHHAAANGHADLCEYLIDHGFDINKTTSHGDTALHLAARSGEADTVERLMCYGAAEIRERNSEGDTPLSIASRSANSMSCWGHYEVLAKLFEGGIAFREFVECNNFDFNALVQHGFVDLCKYLVDQKHVDVNQTDEQGRSAVHFVNNPFMLKLLIELGVAITLQDKEGNTIVHHLLSRQWAYNEGVLAVFDELELLRDALKYYIQQGGDINAQNKVGSPLLSAAFCRDHEKAVTFCELLLQNGADVNQSSGEEGSLHYVTPLLVACELENEALFSLFCANGASHERALLDAAITGSATAVQFLLDHNVNINAQDDKNGFTALHYAAQNDREEIVELLIRKNINTDVQSSNNEFASALIKSEKVRTHFSSESLKRDDIRSHINDQEQVPEVNDEAACEAKLSKTRESALQDIPLVLNDRLKTIRKNKGGTRKPPTKAGRTAMLQNDPEKTNSSLESVSDHCDVQEAIAQAPKKVIGGQTHGNMKDILAQREKLKGANTKE